MAFVEFFNNLEGRLEVAQEEEKKFRAMLPTTGFIGAYLKYTDRQESPGSFHGWVAITILGACLQRRAWISKGIYNVYPNLYTLLIAPSGICRKSKAIDLGLELIMDFDWMNIIADKTTPEGILQALMYGTKAMESQNGAPLQTAAPTDSTGLIQAGELVDFVNKQTHNSGLVSLLTKIYDCPNAYRYLTRNKAPIILKNIAVSFLGGSTPDWFAKELPPAAFGGGFMSRFVFMVKAMRDRSECWPEKPDPSEKKLLQEIMLRARAQVTGNIPFEHEARVWFESWYKETELEQVEDSNLTGFHERKPDIILKVALILCASDCRKVISLQDVQRAHAIVSWTQARAFIAFRDVDLSPLGLLANQIMDFIASQPSWVTRRSVMRKFSRRLPNGTMDMEKIEALFEATQEIKIEAKGSGGTISKRYLKVHKEDQDD